MTDWFDTFLQSAEISCWQAWDIPAYESRIPPGHHSSAGRIVPIRPDGFVVGNGLMLGAVGCRFRQGKLWPTAISHLKGPSMGFRTLAEPFQRGGGEYTSPYPAHDFLLEIDGKASAPDAADRRTLRGIAGSAITSGIVLSCGIELATVDFAPLTPRLPAIIRAVKITNRGPRTRNVSVYPYLCFSGKGDAARYECADWERATGIMAHGRSLSYTALNSGLPPDKPFVLLLASDGPVEWAALGGAQSGCWEGILSGRPPRAPSSRPPFDGALKVALGRLAPGESSVFSTFLIAAHTREEAESFLRQITQEGTERLLGETHAWWQRWIRAPSLKTSSARVNHLIDTLQVLNAIHATAEGQPFNGLTQYGLAMWTRDSYDQIRAFLKAGKRDAAREALCWFMKCWETWGTSNSYHIEEMAGDGTYAGYYELPALHALLARDFLDWVGGDEQRERISAYAAGAAGEIRLTENSLCRLSGDETWAIPVVTNRLAEVPDNSCAAALAFETAFQLTGKAEYRERAQRVRDAVARLLLTRDGRFCHFRTKDGTLEERPITNMLTRALMLGYAASSDPVLRKGVETAWKCNRTDDGVVREDPLSSGFPGNESGYLLYDFAELDACAGDELFTAMLDLAAVSGVFWEFYFTTDRNLSGERLRSWDSAACQEGLLHWIYGISPEGEGVRIAPRLPPGIEWVRVKDFPVRDRMVSYELNASEYRVHMDGKEVLGSNRPVRLHVTDRQISVRPFGKTPPYLDTPATTYDRTKKLLVLSPSMGKLELTMDGIHCRFDLAGSTCRIEVRNGAGFTITVAFGNEERRLPSGARHAFALDDEPHRVNLSFMSRHYQALESLEPSQDFLLRGRVHGNRGVPYYGPLRLAFADYSMDSRTDDLGYFEVPLKAPSEPADKQLVVEMPRLRQTASIRVFEDPLSRIDDILAADGRPQCSILATRDEQSLRAAWEVWYATALARGVSLPLVNNENECAEAHIIQIGDATAATGRESFTFAKENGRFRFLLPATDDVRNLQPFLNALNTHIRRPAGLSSLAAFRGGCAPGITARIDCAATDSLWISGNKCASGTTAPVGAMSATSPLTAPFVGIFVHGTMLVVEADSAGPMSVRVSLRIPQGVPPYWQWSRYVDPVDDSIDVLKEAEGGHTIEIGLTPGKPLEQKRVGSRPTYRRAEFDVAECVPDWYR